MLWRDVRLPGMQNIWPLQYWSHNHVFTLTTSHLWRTSSHSVLMWTVGCAANGIHATEWLLHIGTLTLAILWYWVYLRYCRCSNVRCANRPNSSVRCNIWHCVAGRRADRFCTDRAATDRRSLSSVRYCSHHSRHTWTVWVCSAACASLSYVIITVCVSQLNSADKVVM